MKEKTLSESSKTFEQKERVAKLNLPGGDAEYRHILPSGLYKVGETLVPIQAGFTAWAFFVGPNKWVVVLSALVAFFGIGFLVRHTSAAPKQNQWIIIKLALVSLCLLIQLLLSVKGSAFLCL